MSINKREISRELGDELRAVSFFKKEETTDINEVEPEEIMPEVPEIPEAPEVPKPPTSKPFSLNKRVVTLEYLDKFEKATEASAQYESVKEFSHTISNLSIILLSVSIMIYLVFYFINPDALSLASLLILSIEAFALLGLTLYSMSKASTYKQIRDIVVSDFSTCSQTIGNPRADAYIPMDMTDMASK